MPLYVKDEEVNALAEQARIVLGSTSKTDAVRTALKELLDKRAKEAPLRERLKRLQATMLANGDPNPDFDVKAYRDEMWGN